MKLNFHNFDDFYPFYISQHSKAWTKIFHFIGTGFFLGMLAFSVLDSLPIFVLWGVVGAYTFAWASHFFIEKNKPATFQYPFYSLLGDFKMFFELLILRRNFF